MRRCWRPLKMTRPKAVIGSRPQVAVDV